VKTPPINFMRQFEFKVFDIDEVKMEEEKFLEKMSYDGWELFFINNEPVDGCPNILVKFYFRKEINYFYEFFKFLWSW
jgi:hypothetical protein